MNFSIITKEWLLLRRVKHSMKGLYLCEIEPIYLDDCRSMQ